MQHQAKQRSVFCSDECVCVCVSMYVCFCSAVGINTSVFILISVSDGVFPAWKCRLSAVNLSGYCAVGRRGKRVLLINIKNRLPEWRSSHNSLSS